MGFESEDSLVVKNYISLTGSLADTTHTERLKQFLAEKKYVPSVLSTIGSLKTKESLSILEQYINSPSEKIRFTVAANLKHFGSEKSAEILHLMKDDESFLVRSLVRIFEESKVPK
jgi:HEAT repeat protein